MATGSGIVTLTTDFGLADAYVAQLHAVLLDRYPAVRIVDMSHAVPPGDLETTLFITECAWPYFPPRTVHVVVVDPRVGTERLLVAVEAGETWLVGPDSGVLSSGLPSAMRPASGIHQTPLGEGVQAVAIEAAAVGVAQVSPTFHGRDLMAPAAAALAQGAPLAELGRPVESLMVAAPPATPIVDGRGAGRVLHIDHFGNVITSFRTDQAGPAFWLEARGRQIAGPVATYHATPAGSEGGQPIVVGGSSGYLEIAWPDGSAAEHLGLRRGDHVRLVPR